MPTWNIQTYGAGYEDVIGRGACVLLPGGTTKSRDGGAIRKTCDACHIYAGGCPLL